ncbi:MAG TPA: SIMPL domain-containing protein [Vicinamibacteria bacterium]|nr:SIMPL domain-containing protein [Vicinamibacteria bacterium]
MLFLLTVLSQLSSALEPHLVVTGRAVISAQPERAAVDVGVITEAPEAQAAASQNASKLDRVLNALRDELGPGADFETLSYTLRPNYRRPAPREEPVLTGYVASNIVRIKDLALDAVGKAIDLASASGSNTIHNISFSLRDENAAKSEALRQAAADARAKADTLAGALGVSVVRILTATEGEPDIVRPMPAFRSEMAMAQADVTTPVEPGTIEIRASVTLVVEISQ